MSELTAEERAMIKLPEEFKGMEDQVTAEDVQAVVSDLSPEDQATVKALWQAAFTGMMQARKGTEIDLEGQVRKKQPAVRDDDMVKFAVNTLKGMGAKFFVDATPYIFLPAENAMYRFHKDDDCYRLLCRFGLLLTQKDYNLVQENLQGIILKDGKKTHIEKFGCYRGDCVYINAGGGIVKITDGPTMEESFTQVMNGTDDVYMLNKHLTPWPILDFKRMQEIETAIGGRGGQVCDSKLCNYLTAYFEEGSLVSRQYQQLVLMRYLSLFLGHLDLRPVMLATGVQNSGKSTLWEKIMWVFFGAKFTPGGMPTKMRDFLSTITNHEVLLFDNIDRANFANDRTVYPEFMDLMCLCSTGGTTSMAQLYKNNVDLNFILRCNLFLTARLNPFPSEASDFQRRIITIPMREPTPAEHRDKDSMREEFLADETDIKLETLVRLRLVLRALIAARGKKGTPLVSQMGGFETFTMQVAEFEAWQNDMIAIWKSFMAESKQTVAEDSPVINLIRCWLGREAYAGITTNVGRWVRSGEIYKELSELYEKKFTQRFVTDSAFGRSLKRNASAMSVLGLQKKKVNGSWTYCFGPLAPEQLQQCKDAYKDSLVKTSHFWGDRSIEPSEANLENPRDL
jgi:hypothetical protein